MNKTATDDDAANATATTIFNKKRKPSIDHIATATKAMTTTMKNHHHHQPPCQDNTWCICYCDDRTAAVNNDNGDNATANVNNDAVF